MLGNGTPLQGVKEMIGKIKALGLAFVAVTALSAMAAPAVHAGVLDIAQSPAVVTAQNEVGQQTKITISKQTGGVGEFSLECEEATLEGTLVGVGQNPAQLQEGTLRPTYAKCKLFGLPATIKSNGCLYTLTGELQPANTFLVDIVSCTAGQPGITIQSSVCQIVIPAQNGLGHVVGTNQLNNPDTVTLDAKVTNVTHTQFGTCADGNNHHSNNLSFQGRTILKAFVDNGLGAQHTLHGHQFTTFAEGAQISVTST
jgi:hypothetical protein